MNNGIALMNTRMALSLGASALLFGGTMVGCTAHGGGGGIASASSRSDAANGRAAARDATQARRALAAGDATRAIPHAEAAVALQPRTADYRVLLGQAYLRAGRFVSARTAFADALTLDPQNGKAALNGALALIATGDWSAARTLLADHAGTIAPADRGLALALAGDPTGGVAVLTEVARSGGTSATVRQNLALSYALAGNWQAARVVAAADMSPADVDQRMEQWAVFAHPASASDQVASLLDVQPVADAGQPVALALNAPVAPVQQAAAPMPAAAPAPAPSAPVDVAELSPQAMASTDAAPMAAPAAALASAAMPAAEPVALQPQPIPIAASRGEVPTIRSAATPFKVAMASAHATPAAAARTMRSARGDWYVQLGAFDTAAGARNAWGQATRRLSALADHVPNGAGVTTKAGRLYRLSVGGFDRGEAVSLCQQVRRAGGACFVRAAAGDQVAQWFGKPGIRGQRVEMAAR